MYYPYFRGKQFDLIALRTLLEENRLSKRIQPIIEPVKKTTAFTKLIDTSQQLAHSFYIIQNPQVGAFATENGLETLRQLPNEKAYLLDQPLETVETPSEMIIINQAAPALASEWNNYQAKVLVPEEFRLLQRVKGQRILSEDAFTRLPRTHFYQEQMDELFSVTHQTYQKKGFVGFSDFSIDSRIYYEHGYPTPILSLHLVYFAKDQLRIHHFLSPEELPSQKEKFLALMMEVDQWMPQLCDNQPTKGLELLLEKAAKEKFPGMGVMRKAAVMHHLELMSRYLDGR
ncbi:hypothetical protein DOK78_001963 [Enterococcus sp. DIV2402]|uniref:Sce7725 family protein n=1 Tax=Candidatus Enterococcus lowellii TaxID=2230877 RepID=A0ABZ2SNG4_9ENTE|nr:sce7725 family protein [Enterococcus sp. DIV2402]MBO0463906.1 sce7725 family protein [Enterococcus sp. DIV2402]